MSVRSPAASPRATSGTAPIPTRIKSASTEDPSARFTIAHAVVALDGGDHRVDPKVDTVCGVEGGEDTGHLRPQDAAKRQVEGFQDGHVYSRAAGRRGHLETDPATPHDHQPTAETK